MEVESNLQATATAKHSNWSEEVLNTILCQRLVQATESLRLCAKYQDASHWGKACTNQEKKERKDGLCALSGKTSSDTSQRAHV